MKKTLFFLFFVIGNLQAQIVRITAGTNLQTAIDNATAGTTFLVEGGYYGNLLINKRVALIGTGYLLGSNGTNTQANPNVSTLGIVDFSSGSQNSIMTGFQVNSIGIATHNITIQRNFVLSSVSIGSVSIADNAIVKQNFVFNQINVHSSSGFIIKNNLIGGSFYTQTPQNAGLVAYNTFNTNYSKCASDSATTTGGNYSFFNTPLVIRNNIFVGKIFVSNSCSVSDFLNFSSFNFNVAGAATNVDISNKITTNFANMFVGYPNNPNGLPKDARFQLPTNSPAKGAGENSTDAGAFGGDEPYVLSGIPVGPVVYDLQVPTSTAVGQTIQVQIKAKVQN